MKILAFESSTLLGGVALLENGKILKEKSSLRQKSHSEVLNQYALDILGESQLNLSDIDAFAVGQGPGSFTGIRVAANIGKTFSYAFKKPLITVDSLTNLAQQYLAQNKVLAIINAYKNMVYYGVFEGKDKDGIPKFIKGPSVIPVKNLGDILTEPMLVIGDGFFDYYDYLMANFKENILRPSKNLDNSQGLQMQEHLEKAQEFPTASVLVQLAHQKLLLNQTNDWNSFLPLYIRASEAEENKQGVVFSPLK